MRKKVGIIVGFVLLAVAILMAIHPGEPYYEGRSFSDWIIASYGGPEQRQAREVIHCLGTNSIPLLLNWIQQPDRPSLSGKTQETKYRILTWLERHRVIKPKSHLWKTDMKGSRRALALHVFEELGPDGRMAIPALVGMLANKSDNPDQISETADIASLALSKMAPYSIPPLTEAAGSTNDQVYAFSAMALGLIGPRAEAAIPTIQRRLEDQRPEIRIGAADIVAKLGGKPSQFMPVLVNALREIDLGYLSFGTDVLLNHKQEAKAAIPVLEERLRQIPDSTTNLDEVCARNLLNGTLHQLTAER